MDDMAKLVALHLDGARQGPGSDESTRLAIELCGIDPQQPVCVADMGCGTGASTLVLAKALKGTITAVDFLPEFLNRLHDQLVALDLVDCVSVLSASMEHLPFEAASLDLIWSEGAIYNMGFEQGICAWRQFLKPGGLLAVSEITWLTDQRPDEIHDYWMQHYPAIGRASEKMAQLEKAGYVIKGYFPLPPHCWLDNYYRPLQKRFDDFLRQFPNDEVARQIVASEQEEIDLYEQYHAYFSYGFYIAQRA